MRKLSLVLSVVMLIGLIAGCAAPAAQTGQPAAQATTAPTVAASQATTETAAATGATTQTAAAGAAAAASGPFTPVKYAAPNCDYKGEFKSIESVDAKTVKFTLCQPDPAFATKVAFSAFGINDADYLKSTGGGGDLVTKPNGTGPYKLVEWRRGDQIILERNDDYWGTKAIPKNLIIRWSPESAQRLVELQSGTVDGIDNPGPDDIDKIKQDSNLQFAPREGSNVFYLGMVNTNPPFDKERVRQAFAMAIDRDRIVKNFYPEGSTVATQFMPPSIFGHSKDLKWYDYNPEEAKKILTEEGVLPGFKTTITYRDVVRPYLPNPGVVAQDIQAQLKDIGVDAKINVMESGAFLDATDRGEVGGFVMLGWGADYPDATNFMDFHFGEGAGNRFGKGFPDIWEQLKQGATKSTPEQRQPFYDKANELVKQHVPMIPIAHGGSGAAYKADVENAYASAIGAEQFGLMNPGGRDTFVWMQNGEPPGLYCGDESDGEALRVCEQILQSLAAYEPKTAKVIPALATKWEANSDLTEWTFTLRDGVKFHNGATFDANDVVESFNVQWDAKNPLHKGRSGNFAYFPGLFGQFLNAPPAK